MVEGDPEAHSGLPGMVEEGYLAMYTALPLPGIYGVY